MKLSNPSFHLPHQSPIVSNLWRAQIYRIVTKICVWFARGWRRGGETEGG